MRTCQILLWIPLPRAVATELLLVATLAPMIVTDIATPLSEVLYATDASEERGAIISTPVSRETTLLLAKCFKTKGAYTRRLQSGWSRLMQKVVIAEDLPEEEVLCSPTRPLAFSFEFIEVFAGSSKVTKALSALGVKCGPPLDISKSEEYNLAAVHVLAWLFHLVERGSLRAFMLEPPCTSFSIMRRPPLRSVSKPYGFNVQDRQTRDGNILTLRSLQLMKKAQVHRVIGLLERPFSAKTKHLPPYQALMKCLESVRYVQIVSVWVNPPEVSTTYQSLGAQVS